ncbi:MAG: hypothetical protein ACR2MP_02680 [Streptosporangiaceae bacterium]
MGNASVPAPGTGPPDTGPPDGDTPAVDRLLTQLTPFLLRNSAEGAFELRYTVRSVDTAYGAHADLLAITEGAVLSVAHPGGSRYTATVHVAPSWPASTWSPRARNSSTGWSPAPCRPPRGNGNSPGCSASPSRTPGG